ncbi:DUF4365 domain-containing protein [uncultured Pedobacter sp.]|uniref:DUF4365 domain-containing protein n=1 Tax=uncultured Pedobacter sp. TaxID=246139 RepID=UPI0025D6CE45|nr:DUF4365 domain-containing protein [uncultured Pedobacter sp.]
MTENDIMEELSRKYVEVIANKGGFFNQTGRDYGNDITLRRAAKSSSRSRYLTSGKSIDFQIKAVLERYVKYHGTYISYDLEVKNYNDLVERKLENGALIPLYLIIFIVPNRSDDWVFVSSTEISLRKCAHWYEIDDNLPLSTNNSTKTIHIPIANVVDLNLFDNLFKKLD